MQPATDVLQVVLNFTQVSDLAHMVFHVQGDSVWSDADVNDTLDAVNTVVVDNLMPVLENSTGYIGANGYDLSDSPVERAWARPVAVVAGGSASDGAQQAALVVSWYSSNPSRNGRGRNYVPGIPSSALLDPAHVNSSFRSSIDAWAAGMQDALVSSANVPTFVVLSRFSKALFPTPPHERTTPVAYPILTKVVNNRLDTQRRRLPRT